ncbi:MAG: redoxin domain-containing protein [bacterium]
MKTTRQELNGVLAALVIVCLASVLFGQTGEIRPVTLGQPMPEFTLPKYQGGELTLSQLKGKNVMILFPRGLAGKDHWCHICNYQYAELLELEEKEHIRKKYDLEILYVLPYDKETVTAWIDAFPAQLADLENWKNPGDASQLDDRAKRRMDFAKAFFPKHFMFEKGKVPTPFPILVDGDRTVSKGLGLFTEEWSGSKIEQNVSTVFLLDKEGIVRFKYFSQSTTDRPGFDYLLKFLDRMILKK